MAFFSVNSVDQSKTLRPAQILYILMGETTSHGAKIQQSKDKK